VSILYDGAARNAFAEQVVKSVLEKRAATVPDKRLTLSIVYSPNSRDAHQEGCTPEALEEAVLDFNKSGNTRLNLQHGDLGPHTVADIMSVFIWPYEVACDFIDPATMKKTKHTVPAGSAWMWVRWDKDSWPLVLTSKIRGYSMGGRAVRVPDPSIGALPHMGFDVRKNANLDSLLDTLKDTDDEHVVQVEDGYLVADEERQAVYHVTDYGIETLDGGTRS
jgi:hypothetical protein